MALESLAAFGLAANIIQFVQFGYKLFSESRVLYKASDKRVEESVELEIISKALKRLSDDLAAIPSSTTPQPQAEAELLPLAKCCQTIADELLVALKELQVKGAKGKWQCFRSALKRIWKSQEIESMARRLDSISAHLSNCLISVLNAKQAGMLSSIGSLLEAAQRLEKQHGSHFGALRVSTLDILQTLKGTHTMYMENREKAQSQHNVMATQIEQLHSKLNKLIAIGQPLELQSVKCMHILESLQYERMTARYEKIVDAHAKTFEWIYDESSLSQHGELQHHFQQWLKTGDGLFWVTGKAGSGKSTLMKFIAEHPKTRQALLQWASDQHLITASFYFWHAGTVFQKSQEGLLKSLLYEIFSQCPEIISDVLPERWKLCKPSNQVDGHWSHAELIEAFAKLSNQPILLKRACFFIDGLDEYDGDHKELIRLLRSFSRPNNIKICASSRPWNVFKRAFGTGSHTMLRLEDLTRNDITLYVRETLEQNDLFNQLRKRENAHCVDLVNEVVSKAQGVFLWVFLVVRSLLTGLTNADRITDLRRRLRLLPADLESYFALMFATIDTVYEQQAAQTFKIALDAPEPQNIMTYIMLDELDEDPQFALRLDIREWESREIGSKIETMVSRINARGMGLLEVVRSQSSDGPMGAEIDFLHRTVRDFFRLRALEDWIAHRLPPSFNTDRLLCNALLARVKTMNVTLARDFGDLYGLVDDIMRHAYHSEIDLGTTPTILLDNLSHTISQRTQEYGRSLNFSRILQRRTSFLSFAVQKNLKLYIAEKLGSRSSTARGEDAYLICRALRPDVSKAPSGNRAMLCLLLEKGMCMTKAANSWGILFSEIADGWAEATEEEKILQFETINTLLLARENPREAIGATSWGYLIHILFGNWLSDSIDMQRVLKTTLSSLLKTASDSDSAYSMNILWCNFMLEVSSAIEGPGVDPAEKDIILETIQIFLQHGATVGEIFLPHAATMLQDPTKGWKQPFHLGKVILDLWRDPYFSTSQKAELKGLLPADQIDHLNLPYRPHLTHGQTLNDRGQSLKRSASEFDSETGSLDQKPFKRRLELTTAPLTSPHPTTPPPASTSNH